MKPRGIPIAQIDSNLEADPKFVKLRLRHPEAGDYYALFGAYMSIVLRAWATGSREPDEDLLDLIGPSAPAELSQVGLLDEHIRIPEPVFSKWVGSVLEARAVDAARKRNVRRTPEDSEGLGRSPQESNESSSPLLSYGHPPGETSESSPSVGSPSGWPYLYPVVVELTGKHAPHGKYAETLCELAEQAGPDVVVAAMRAVADRMAPVRPDLRALTFGVNDALRRPPSGRDIAGVVADEQERAYAARKAAERSEARRDRQRRALALVDGLEASE